MNRTTTAMIWIAVLLFVGAYIFPLWSITLRAPQYPEGMGMNIWISKITGMKKHDLNNINRLNHYIGMKAIHPESIAELRFMKYIIAGLMLIGLLAGLTRRRAVVTLWVVLSLLAAGAGLADFYKWGYDYGHNLDPDAPIKVPGMSYQPPVIGTKKLLNITATSYPAVGGLMLMLGVGLGSAALVVEWKRSRRRKLSVIETEARPVHAAAALLAVTIALAALGSLASCSVGPSPIRFGTDTCHACHMTISDERYGAEIVTKKGRVYKYDSVECMAGDIVSGEFTADEVHAYLTIDHASPARLVDAARAVYLHSPAMRSPMGMNLTSFENRSDAEAAAGRHDGQLLTFVDVQRLIKRHTQTGAGHSK